MVMVAARERVATWIVNRLLSSSNKRVDIAELQKRHGAYAEKITRLEITDLKRSWLFRIHDGHLELVSEGEADGGFSMDTNTLISIALGKRKMKHPGTGRVFEVDYTPLQALQMGDLQLWGEAASNDALLFARRIYRDVYPRIQEDLKPEPEGSSVPPAGSPPSR